MSHSFESRFDYKYRRPDAPGNPAAWAAASAALDTQAADILAVSVIARLWHHAMEAGYARAALLMSVGLWRHELQRHSHTAGGYTVLLPEDAAFGPDFDGHFAVLAADEGAAALRKLLLDHVLPERLYLVPGDLLQPVDDEAPAEGREVRALGGRRWRVVPRTAAAAAAFVVAAPQARVNFAAVYRIGGALVDLPVRHPFRSPH